MSHSASVRALVKTLSREISGERCRGSVRKAMPEKSAVVVSTLRRPLTMAPPKLRVEKIFLCDFPGHDFTALRSSLTVSRFWRISPFPRQCLLHWSADSQGGHALVRAILGLPRRPFRIKPMDH